MCHCESSILSCKWRSFECDEIIIVNQTAKWILRKVVEKISVVARKPFLNGAQVASVAKIVDKEDSKLVFDKRSCNQHTSLALLARLLSTSVGFCARTVG